LKKGPKNLQNRHRRFAVQRMDRQPQLTHVFGSFTLDVAERRLLRDGRHVPLTPKMFELLRVLVENAGHLVEKAQLLKEVWSDAFVEEASLNRGVSVLRRTLGETPANRFIETVPKRGYRFVAPVRVVDSSVPTVEAGSNSVNRRSHRTVIVAVGLLGAVALAIAALVVANQKRDQTAAAVQSAGASIHRQLTFSGKELTPTLSPDGARIAFVSNESPHRKVMVRGIDAGQAVEIFSAPEVGGLRWSPDSTELMFRVRGGGLDGLYVAPARGGARRISHDNLFVACWSPDGQTIAMAVFLPKRIQFVNRVGEIQRSISLSGIRDWIWDIDWSTASGRLLFVADDEQQRATIWTIRPDGSDQRRVLSAETEIPAARWAPSGDALYYFGRVNQTVSLYKASLDRGRERSDAGPAPVVSGLETDEAFALSADGRRLVYARNPYYSNLWVVEAGDAAHGGQLRQKQLTNGTSLIERPRVSPNGRSILFNMGYESRADLYTIPATGGVPTQLTFLNALSVGGVWSPDGRMVAFASTEGGKPRIWVVNADGSSPRPLPVSDPSDTFELAWAPGDRPLYQITGGRNYSIIDLQGRRQQSLIKDSSVGWVASPAYSPDRRKLVVAWNRPPVHGLFVFDAVDLRETLIYRNPGPTHLFPWPIGWSSDAKFIYAYRGKRAATRGVTVPYEETLTEASIVRISLAGGHVETIVSLPYEEIGSITMFPDGRKFLCTVYSSRSDVWVVEDFDASVRPRLALGAQ
jgi:Tol biopolymer transport system component/DNA-binding winged helix-turn-helix (wHTH) protein